jgi:hypothetical protein
MKHLKLSFLVLSGIPFCAGCDFSGRSPTINVLGSYFPAWMACIVMGLFLTLITRELLIGMKLNNHLYPAPLVYLGMLMLFTFAAWLALFNR